MKANSTSEKIVSKKVGYLLKSDLMIIKSDYTYDYK